MNRKIYLLLQKTNVGSITATPMQCVIRSKKDADFIVAVTKVTMETEEHARVGYGMF